MLAIKMLLLRVVLVVGVDHTKVHLMLLNMRVEELQKVMLLIMKLLMLLNMRLLRL